MTFLFAIKAMQNNVFISKLQIFSYSLTQKTHKTCLSVRSELYFVVAKENNNIQLRFYMVALSYEDSWHHFNI